MSCTYKKSTEPASKKVNPPADGKTKASGTSKVSLNTSIGDLQLTLDSALAPCTVKNFLSLVGQKFFDNTKCHRLTVGEGLQVLQCGDPTGTGGGGPGYSFADEVYPTLKYGRGVLAMANSGANTNGSQFFIVYGDASGLGPQYTAFGTVDEAGLKLIDKVAKTGVDAAERSHGRDAHHPGGDQDGNRRSLTNRQPRRPSPAGDGRRGALRMGQARRSYLERGQARRAWIWVMPACWRSSTEPSLKW